jgi:hypothetical protein
MGTPAEAAQIIITIIPIVGIVAACVVLFLYILLQHRQAVRMIEKGTFQRRSINLYDFCLLSGIVLLALGATLSIFFVVMEGFTYSLLGGLIPLAIGGGFITFIALGGGAGNKR